MRNRFENFDNYDDRPDFVEPEIISEFVNSQNENPDIRIDNEGIREVLEDLGFPTSEIK